MNQIVKIDDGVLDLAVRIALKIVDGTAKQRQMDVSHRMMPGWLSFSQTESRILRLLLKHQALSREQIAARLGESPDGKVKSVLATLTGRKVLLVTADGYQANVSTADRPAALALLGPDDDAAADHAGLNGSAQPAASARPARATTGPLPHDETAGPLSDRQIAERIAAARAQGRANGHSTIEADVEANAEADTA